ncbi:MAG: hypothetical protein ACRCZD_06030 [Phycicoccus sp.]
MRWTTHAAQALIRAVAVLVLGWSVGTLVEVVSPTEDANIGAGLLQFAAMALGAFLGGAFDGHRRGVGTGLLLWGLASVPAAFGFAALAQVGPGASFDGSVYLDDLRALGPFGALLVAAPAGVGVALGTALRPTDPPPASHPAG